MMSRLRDRDLRDQEGGGKVSVIGKLCLNVISADRVAKLSFVAESNGT
jgi:hypothetical protein